MLADDDGKSSRRIKKGLKKKKKQNRKSTNLGLNATRLTLHCELGTVGLHDHFPCDGVERATFVHPLVLHRSRDNLKVPGWKDHIVVCGEEDRAVLIGTRTTRGEITVLCSSINSKAECLNCCRRLSHGSTSSNHSQDKEKI